MAFPLGALFVCLMEEQEKPLATPLPFQLSEEEEVEAHNLGFESECETLLMSSLPLVEI